MTSSTASTSNNNIIINKSLYICKRVQLLKETEKKPEKWKNYLKMRSILLKQHCESSVTKENNYLSNLFNKMGLSSDTINNNQNNTGCIVSATDNANPQVIKDEKSTVENYSFAGVHHIFDQHKSCVTMVKFANKNIAMLCCSSMDGSLTICSVAQKPLVLFTLLGHTAGVTCFDWSNNNDIIASCSFDSSIRIWKTVNGQCLSTIQWDDSQYFCCLFQPANNNLLMVGNNVGTVQTVNISTSRFSKVPCKLTGSILSLAFDTMGKMLWVGNDKGYIYTLKCDVSGTLTKIKKLMSSNASISSLSFKIEPNKDIAQALLLANSTNNTITIYSICDKDQRLILKHKFENKHPTFSIKSTFCPMTSYKKGACIVTGSENGSIYFLNIEKNSTKACINTLQGHSKPVIGINFNYNESLLATSDLDGFVIIWKRTNNLFDNRPMDT